MLRNMASGNPMPPIDENIIVGTAYNVAPADKNALAFQRTPAMVSPSERVCVQCGVQRRSILMLCVRHSFLQMLKHLTCVEQVINIVALGSPNGEGGFFPNGLNGAINGTDASIGSTMTLAAILAGACSLWSQAVSEM